LSALWTAHDGDFDALRKLTFGARADPMVLLRARGMKNARSITGAANGIRHFLE
jgi:hypothetical protein